MQSDAHVRFDERDLETEHGRASEAPAHERAGQRIGTTYTTAPGLDSTRKNAPLLNEVCGQPQDIEVEQERMRSLSARSTAG